MGHEDKQIKYQVHARRSKQVKVSVDPDLAHKFSIACANIDVSMAEVISKFMSDFTNTANKKKPMPDYSTKRQRRAAIKKIIKQLE